MDDAHPPMRFSLTPPSMKTPHIVTSPTNRNNNNSNNNSNETLRHSFARSANYSSARMNLNNNMQARITVSDQYTSSLSGSSASEKLKDDEATSDYNQWLHAMKLVARLPGGMPPEFRRKLWLSLADKYLKSRNVDWAQEEKKCFSEKCREDDEELGVQIVKDLHRTGSNLCTGPAAEINQAKLKRILLGYARYNPEVGYCQGFNMLGALILQVMDKEEIESMKVMIYLVEGILPPGYFCGSMGGLQADMGVFRELMQSKLPRLAKHLGKLQGPGEIAFEPPLTNVFTMQWFLTMFCTCLPMSCVLRVWDLVLIEGSDVLLRTALVLWSLLEERVLKTRSADEFYCKMGSFASELLNGHLIDSNSLIEKVVQLGPIADIQKLRNKHLCTIAALGPKSSIPLYLGDEEPDNDEESRLAIATVWGIPWSRRGSQGPVTSSKQAPATENKDRLALDISLLKKQYDRLRERQKQAHIIITTACSTAKQGTNTNVSPSVMPVNQLLMGRTAIMTNQGKRIGPHTGAIPPARKPSLPTILQSRPAEKQLRRGETLHWRDADPNKGRRDSLTWKEIKADRAAQIKDGSAKVSQSKKLTSRIGKSDSSSYSEESEDDVSSTDTSLCDDDPNSTGDKIHSSSIENSPKRRTKSVRREKPSPMKLLGTCKSSKDAPYERIRPKSWAPTSTEIPFVLMTPIQSPQHGSNDESRLLMSHERTKEEEDSTTECDRHAFKTTNEPEWAIDSYGYSPIAGDLVTTTVGTLSIKTDMIDLPMITSTSQLSPIADITLYLKETIISPLPTPKPSLKDSINSLGSGDDDDKKKFDVSDDGVTNEYFERVNSVERPTKLNLVYSLNEDDDICHIYEDKTKSQNNDDVADKDKQDPVQNTSSNKFSEKRKRLEFLIGQSEDSSPTNSREETFGTTTVFEKVDSFEFGETDFSRGERDNYIPGENLDDFKEITMVADELNKRSEDKISSSISSLSKDKALYLSQAAQKRPDARRLPLTRSSTMEIEERFQALERHFNSGISKDVEIAQNKNTTHTKYDEKSNYSNSQSVYEDLHLAKIPDRALTNKLFPDYEENVGKECSIICTDSLPKPSKLSIPSTADLEERFERQMSASDKSENETVNISGSKKATKNDEVKRRKSIERSAEKQESLEKTQVSTKGKPEKATDGINESEEKASIKKLPSTTELEDRFHALERKLSIEKSSPTKTKKEPPDIDKKSKSEENVDDKNQTKHIQKSAINKEEISPFRPAESEIKTDIPKKKAPPSTEELEKRFQALEKQMSTTNLRSEKDEKDNRDEKCKIELSKCNVSTSPLDKEKKQTDLEKHKNSCVNETCTGSLEKKIVHTERATKAIDEVSTESILSKRRASEPPSTEDLERRYESFKRRMSTRNAAEVRSSKAETAEKDLRSKENDIIQEGDDINEVYKAPLKGSTVENKEQKSDESVGTSNFRKKSELKKVIEIENCLTNPKTKKMSIEPDIANKDSENKEIVKNVSEIEAISDHDPILSEEKDLKNNQPNNNSSHCDNQTSHTEGRLSNEENKKRENSLTQQIANINHIPTPPPAPPDEAIYKLSPQVVLTQERRALIEELQNKINESSDAETLKPSSINPNRKAPLPARNHSAAKQDETSETHAIPALFDSENYEPWQVRAQKTVRRFSDLPSRADLENRLEFLEQKLYKKLYKQRCASDSEVASRKHFMYNNTEPTPPGSSKQSTEIDLEKRMQALEKQLSENSLKLLEAMHSKTQQIVMECESPRRLSTDTNDETGGELVRYIHAGELEEPGTQKPFSISINIKMMLDKSTEAKPSSSELTTTTAELERRLEALEQQLKASREARAQPEIDRQIELPKNEQQNKILDDIEDCQKKKDKLVVDISEFKKLTISTKKSVEETEDNEKENEKKDAITEIKIDEEPLNNVKKCKPTIENISFEETKSDLSAEVVADEKKETQKIESSLKTNNLQTSDKDKSQCTGQDIERKRDTKNKTDLPSKEESVVVDEKETTSQNESTKNENISQERHIAESITCELPEKLLINTSEVGSVDENKKTLVLLLDNEPKAVKVRRLTRANTEELEGLFEALEKQLSERNLIKSDDGKLKHVDDQKERNEVMKEAKAISDLTKEIEEFTSAEKTTIEHAIPNTDKAEQPFDWGPDLVKRHLKRKTVHLPSTKELEARFRSLERQIKLLEDVETIDIDHRLQEIERKIKLQYSLAHEKDITKYLELCEGKDPENKTSSTPVMKDCNCECVHRTPSKSIARSPRTSPARGEDRKSPHSPAHSSRNSKYFTEEKNTENSTTENLGHRYHSSKIKNIDHKKQPIHPLEMLLDPSPDDNNIPTTGELEHRIKVLDERRPRTPTSPRKARSRSPAQERIRQEQSFEEHPRTPRRTFESYITPTKPEPPTADELDARMRALEEEHTFDFKTQKDFKEFSDKLKNVISPSLSLDECKATKSREGSPKRFKDQSRSPTPRSNIRDGESVLMRSTSPKVLRFRDDEDLNERTKLHSDQYRHPMHDDLDQRKMVGTSINVVKTFGENSKTLHRILKTTITDSSESRPVGYSSMSASLAAEGLEAMGTRLMRETSPLRRTGTVTGVPLRTSDNINERLSSIKDTIKSIDSLCEEKPYRKEKCQRYIDSLFSDSVHFTPKKSSFEDLRSRSASRTRHSEYTPAIQVSDLSQRPSDYYLSRSIGSAESIRMTSPLRAASPLHYRSNRDLSRNTDISPSRRGRRCDEEREECESRVRRDNLLPNFFLDNHSNLRSSGSSLTKFYKVDSQLESYERDKPRSRSPSRSPMRLPHGSRDTVVHSYSQTGTQNILFDLDKPYTPYRPTTHNPLGSDSYKRSNTPVYNPSKLEIRHTTVTSTFYDRLLTEKQIEKSLTRPQIYSPATSPSLANKTYLETSLTTTTSATRTTNTHDFSKVSFNSFTTTPGTSHQNTNTLLHTATTPSGNSNSHPYSQVSLGSSSLLNAASYSDLRIRSCDNILMQLHSTSTTAATLTGMVDVTSTTAMPSMMSSLNNLAPTSSTVSTTSISTEPTSNISTSNFSYINMLRFTTPTTAITTVITTSVSSILPSSSSQFTASVTSTASSDTMASSLPNPLMSSPFSYLSSTPYTSTASTGVNPLISVPFLPTTCGSTSSTLTTSTNSIASKYLSNLSKK